jgi:hypothetical protein
MTHCSHTYSIYSLAVSLIGSTTAGGHRCSHVKMFVHISRVFPRGNHPLSPEREVQTARPRALLELHFFTTTRDAKAFPRSLWVLSHPTV